MTTFSDFKKKYSIDQSKEIPQGAVTLPSNGTKATIRPMKVKEQKDFLKAFEKKDEFLLNEAFDRILSSCVISVDDKPYDNDVICVQDRTFLLIKIRQLTSGDKIKIPHYSADSDKVQQIEVDISKFPVETHEGNLNSEIDVSESVKLVLGPVTRKNEKDLEKYLKSKGDLKDSVIERRYCAYAALIKEIKSKDDKGEWSKVDATYENMVEFVTSHCSEKELKQIDEYTKTLDFGIRLKLSDAAESSDVNDEASLLSFFII